MLTSEKALADYFEKAVETGQDPNELAKWIAGDLSAMLKEAVVPIQHCPVSPRGLGELVALVAQRDHLGKDGEGRPCARRSRPAKGLNRS